MSTNLKVFIVVLSNNKQHFEKPTCQVETQCYYYYSILDKFHKGDYHQ